jgi:predicted permease
VRAKPASALLAQLFRVVAIAVEVTMPRGSPMHVLLNLVALTAPLFGLILLGYALVRWGRWPREVSDALTRFVFSVAVPALLFRLMSNFSRMPPVDARLLLAFFGSCLIGYIVGRIIAKQVFGMDGVSQSVFALGGIFANNVLLGIPLAKVTLGEGSLPAISLVLVFNALLLWTLVTVSVEWARTGSTSFRGLLKTGKNVVANPIVASILLGTGFGLLALPLPAMIDQTLELIAQAAVPLSLIALGMGLAEFGLREGWRESAAICALKLALQPLVVLGLARLIGLPPLETQVGVMLASLPVGANVFLMARQFNTLEGPIASSLVFSTAFAAVTTPLVLTLSALALR